MPNSSFLPSRDTALLAWSLNFSTLINSGPGTYNLTPAQAANYQSYHNGFSIALAACDPGHRSKSLVAAKNDARENLKVQARALASLIEGTLTVTDAQKIALGLNVRSAPSPIPAPTDAPALDVISVTGRTVRIRLHDSTDSSRRGRPVNVAGATVFSFVGDEPPAQIAAWKFETNTTRTTVSVTFPDSVAAGAQVWVTAFWRNERDQSGPACTPVSTNVQFGNSMAA